MNELSEMLQSEASDPRAKIMAIQAAIAQQPQIEFPVKHHFAPGAYGREILLFAGPVVVGKIHRHAHVNVISQGRCTVYTEGDGLIELQAPATFVSKPGTKRVVFAHTDVVWTTVHVTDETDLAKIEAAVIAPSFDSIEHSALQVLQ